MKREEDQKPFFFFFFRIINQLIEPLLHYINVTLISMNQNCDPK